MEFKVKSQSDKSGYINITYNNINQKTDTKRLIFYVYNENYNNIKFQMDYIDSVLLPITDDNFIVWIGAAGDSFTFDILKSTAVNQAFLYLSVLAMAVLSLVL